MLTAPSPPRALALPARRIAILPPVERRCEIVVCAVSANGLTTLLEIVSALPPDFPVAFVLVANRVTHFPAAFSTALQERCSLPVEFATAGGLVKGGVVYMPPPDCAVSITADRRFIVWHENLLGTSKTSDALFTSAAKAYSGKLVALLLSGGSLEHTHGVRLLRRSGGLAISADDEKIGAAAAVCDAGETCCVDFAVPRETIRPVLESLTLQRPRRPARQFSVPMVPPQLTAYTARR